MTSGILNHLLLSSSDSLYAGFDRESHNGEAGHGCSAPEKTFAGRLNFLEGTDVANEVNVFPSLGVGD